LWSGENHNEVVCPPSGECEINPPKGGGDENLADNDDNSNHYDDEDDKHNEDDNFCPIFRSARYVLRRVAAAIAVVAPSPSTLASPGAKWNLTPSWSIQSAKAVLSRSVLIQPLQTLQCPLPGLFLKYGVVSEKTVLNFFSLVSQNIISNFFLFSCSVSEKMVSNFSSLVSEKMASNFFSSEQISALRSVCQEENAGTTENRLLMSSSTQTTAVWWQDL